MKWDKTPIFTTQNSNLARLEVGGGIQCIFNEGRPKASKAGGGVGRDVTGSFTKIVARELGDATLR